MSNREVCDITSEVSGTCVRQPQTPWRLNWPTVFWIGLVHLGALAAPWVFSWSALGLTLLMGWLTGGIGICLGFHRLFTHRSFAVVRPLRWFIALLGSLAGEGSVMSWAADHRKHHALSDQPGDPHSPRDGVWWSHMLWLAWVPEGEDHEAYKRRWVPDLVKERALRVIDRGFLLWNLLAAAGLFALGYGLGGAALAWSFLVWGMFVRLVYVLHSTWLVNSATHLWGYRNYATRDGSRNLWWVALLTYGEGWHNNHHAHPRVASNRHRWWEVDPTFAVIRVLRRLGLAWNVVEVRQEPARASASESPSRPRIDSPHREASESGGAVPDRVPVPCGGDG